MKQWTKTLPTRADVGKWFLYRLIGGRIDAPEWHVEFAEIRWDESMKALYLAKPCNTGIQKTSYGNDIRLYKDIEFWGPLDMPSDYRSPFPS